MVKKQNCVIWIKDIAEDVETRFYNLNYELDRPLPKGEN